jgi:hypothetical protein
MEAIAGLLGNLWEVWSEMFKLARVFALKVAKLLIWFIFGIFILPCVYVASAWYPKWTDWGEKM